MTPSGAAFIRKLGLHAVQGRIIFVSYRQTMMGVNVYKQWCGRRYMVPRTDALMPGSRAYATDRLPVMLKASGGGGVKCFSRAVVEPAAALRSYRPRLTRSSGDGRTIIRFRYWATTRQRYHFSTRCAMPTKFW